MLGSLSQFFKVGPIIALTMNAPLAAQEFADVQGLANRVLFAKQDVAVAARAVEQRRIANLYRRSQEQAVVLEQQAASIRQLSGELQLSRVERQVIDVADGFDAALVARRWASARALVDNEVALDLDGAGIARTLSADQFIADLPGLVGSRPIYPRSNQRAIAAGENVVLASNGFAWAGSGRGTRDRQPGRFEYSFRQSPDGWKISGIRFQGAAGN